MANKFYRCPRCNYVWQGRKLRVSTTGYPRYCPNCMKAFFEDCKPKLMELHEVIE